MMRGNEMKSIQEAFDMNWVVPLGSDVNACEEIPGQAQNEGGKFGMTRRSRSTEARLRLQNGAKTFPAACWSTAGGTKKDQNVPRGVLEISPLAGARSK